MSKRDAAADLAMLNKTCRACSGTGVLRSPVAEGECGNCDGTGIAYPDEDMVALAEYWIERAEHLEAENEEVRHELDRSRNAHGKAELELARLRTTLASIEEYGTEEINAGIELRQENARLSTEANALDRLRAWRTKSPQDLRWELTDDWLGFTLDLVQKDDFDGIFQSVVVTGNGDGIPAKNHIVLGTPDSPATFTEMVEAAMARWSDLYGEQQ